MSEVWEHDFISINVVPIDVRAVADGVEYTEAPERADDPTPEQFCQICYVELTSSSVNTPCPGIKVPDSPMGLV